MGSGFSLVKVNGLSYSAEVEGEWPQLFMVREANDYCCSGSCNSEVRIFEHKV